MSISIIIKLFAIAGQRAGWTKLADIFEMKNSKFYFVPKGNAGHL